MRGGLSPRVRGKRSPEFRVFGHQGSIPACAGETRCRGGCRAVPGVYPRVCGGNHSRRCASGHRVGLSPRVRGKPRYAAVAEVLRGSIPACAGETRGTRRLRLPAAVYPRVCGGNYVSPGFSARSDGLSPRVRGKPDSSADRQQAPGSIPACAGETPQSPASSGWSPVYPRVCGGNGILGVAPPPIPGLSPRVRGKLRCARNPKFARRSIPACAGETDPLSPTRVHPEVYPRVCGGNNYLWLWQGKSPGLSPRVRGKRSTTRLLSDRERSIPACAGETRAPAWHTSDKWVYPRVCGGNRVDDNRDNDAGGLSPRVRGKRPASMRLTISARSIPACAGETPRPISAADGREVYPRVCGGNRVECRRECAAGGLSPRVRGKHCDNPPTGMALRSIPACAGETPVGGSAAAADWVYPRVCGGNYFGLHDPQDDPGLSPRVRGKRNLGLGHLDAPRSIPACAGETPGRGQQLYGLLVYPRVCGGNGFSGGARAISRGLSPRVRGKRGGWRW